MVENLKEVLKNQIEIISPSKQELKSIADKTKDLIDEVKKNIAKTKIFAEIFVGGSFAKNTLIRKNKYDVDIFVRFDSRYKDISELLAKIIPKNAIRIHGSRDYFSLKNSSDSAEFELIPTIKIKSPEMAQNITDLSFFHVKYVGNKIKKNPKLINEIRLAKAFAYFQDCYGAESYIRGFSGYALELLIIYYGSFINFIKAIAKSLPDKKIILDPEKKFKNKNIELELNESKLQSPIVLIDPTFGERNALAALSNETFERFRLVCMAFLKNPSSRFFKLIDSEKLMREKYNDVLELKLYTDKQAGDIAGTKLKKFYGYFIQELERFFDIKKHHFIYDEKENTGKMLIVATQKKELIISGPPLVMKEPFARFKKEHKIIKIKNKTAYAIEKSINFKTFLTRFLNQKSKTIQEMDISRIEKI